MGDVVIVGASHAAAEVVATLHKKKFAGKITLVGEEPYLPYQRPPLSKKYLNDEVSLEKLYIRAPSSYEDAGVEQKLGLRAESIDRQQRQVQLSNGESLHYDKLILATGTSARKLPIPGAELEQIKYLRTKDDVDAIKDLARHGARLLIIGAGYIGLEVAASTVKQGMQVTVLEAMDRVLQRVTSPVISEFYQSLHADAGVDIRLNTTVQQFHEAGDGVIATLGDGSELEFDCAVVGIGVIPNTQLAEAAGLACENGILVDEFCRTTDHCIYAIGDCSNHPSAIYERNLRLESVPNAMGQGKTAALSICDEPIPYDEVPWFWSDQYDVKLQTVGLSQGHDQIVVRGDQTAKKFSVFYLQAGRLIAVDAINSPAEFMLSRKLVPARANPDPEQLADPEIAMKTFLPS